MEAEAGLPTRFCAGRQSTVNDLYSRLYIRGKCNLPYGISWRRKVVKEQEIKATEMSAFPLAVQEILDKGNPGVYQETVFPAGICHLT